MSSLMRKVEQEKIIDHDSVFYHTKILHKTKITQNYTKIRNQHWNGLQLNSADLKN